jgi:hypothetical protein
MKSFALVGIVLSVSSLADTQTTERLRVNVRLVARGTPVDGPTRAFGSAAVIAAQGERRQLMFSANDTFCRRLIGEDPDSGRNADRDLTRRRVIDVTVVDARTDRIRLDVINERSDDGNASEQVRHLTLNEGEPHLLDVLETTNIATDPSCRIATVTLELSAAIVENDSFANDSLSYEMWLTSRDRNGRELVRHLSQDGRQGEQTSYRFRSLRRRLSDLRSGMTWPIELDQSVSGSIRGRLRADGRVDLSLTTSRDVAWLWSGGPGMGATGDGGAKQFSARLDEPVRIDLPPTRGRSLALGPAGERVSLDYADLFDGYQMSLVVVVSRQR